MMEDRRWRMENGDELVTCAPVGSLTIASLAAEVIGAVDHAIEHGADTLPGTVQIAMSLRCDVLVIQCVIEPRLRFHCLALSLVEFVNEHCLIATARPRFGNHRANSA